MVTTEPVDEEHLPTFSLGLEFLTSEKENLKKRKKENKQGPCKELLKRLLFQ